MENQKRKNIFFLFLSIILILFSLSCVSATNNNTYVSVSGNNSWDGSSPTHTNATNGPKQTIASGINVTGSGGNLYIANGTYKESNLQIKINLTINGQGNDNTTINAWKNNLIFWIYPGTIVTIKNLNLTNGSASSTNFSGNGGCIYNQGTLTIDSCILTSNTAKNGKDADKSTDATKSGYGGAIYNIGTLNITNCNITYNHAGNGGDADPGQGHSSHGGYGGAIYNSGTLNTKNCNFTGNHAGDGGDGSDVHDGGSGGLGGAIYNENIGTITNIQGCHFINNYAGDGGDGAGDSCGGTAGNGGAIYNSNKINNISSSHFKSNYAGDGHHGGTAGNGGAIYNNATISTIQICTFETNKAGNGGSTSGGIEGNDAKPGGNGGAIFNSGNSTLKICTLIDNSAGTGGKPNSGPKGGAYGGNGGNGGAIYNTKYMIITNSKLLENKGGKGGDYNNAPGLVPGNGGYGGAIYNSGNLTINSNTEILRNKAGKGGIDGKLGHEFQGGNGGNGGAIYNSGSTTIENSKINDNKAEISGYGYSAGNGGAVYNTGSLTISESEINKNSAGDDIYNGGSKHGVGCGIYSDTSKYNVNISFCSVANNKAIYMTGDNPDNYKINQYHDAVYLKSSSSNTIKLLNNWWGYNNDNNELKSLIKGSNSNSSYYNPFYTPWLKLSIIANPPIANQVSNVTASLIMNSNGQNTQTIYGMTVPDGIIVKFDVKLGTVDPTTNVTKNGAANTTFTPSGSSGSPSVTAKVDQQKVTTPSAALQLTKTVDKPVIYLGNTFQITYKLVNKGPDISKDVIIKIPIGNAFKFINASPDQGTFIYDPSTGILTWNVGNVQLEELNLYIQLKAMQLGTFTLKHLLITPTFDPNLYDHITPLIITVKGTSGQESTFNTAGRTIEMRKTGLPIAGLILAFLMLFGGYVTSKRK